MSKIQEYTVGYLFDSSGEHVTLIEKTNCSPEQKWQEGCLNGIGGKVQQVGHIDHPEKTWPTSFTYESPKQAMRREFREEAGVDIPEENWEHFLTLEKKSNGTGEPIVLYFFKCFSTERLQQVKTSSNEGEVSIIKVPEILSMNVIEKWKVFLALERNKKYQVKEDK